MKILQPFERLTGNKSFKESAHLLLSLSGRCFASAFKNILKIWNSDFKLLNQFEMSDKICDLKASESDLFLIQTSYDHISICNYKTGEIWKDIFQFESLCSCFQTIDKVFMVLLGIKNILFYHLKGSYIYYKTEFVEPRFIPLKDGRIVYPNHENGIIEIRDFKR